MLVGDVASIIEDFAPLALGTAGDELGLLAGDPHAEVKGVVTCWSPTLGVLRTAVEKGANMVISHEPLTYRVCGRDPEAGLKWYDERHTTAKVPNQKRLAFVFEHGLTVYRYHSNWDFAPGHGIIDALARRLGLDGHNPREFPAPVYVITPTTVRELATRARRTLGLGPIRVVGDLARRVSRVALCVGGFGQMFTFPEVVLEKGAELAFFGEMLDYTVRYCVETDLAAVELGHCQSEHPGMMAMAEYLRSRLPPTIPVQGVHSGEPWTCFAD